MLLDALTRPLFRTLSRLRGARVFHPRGMAYEASWHPSDGDPLGVGTSGQRVPSDAVVRVSRGAGLPPPLPDVLGVAIKVVDLHGPGHDQDLLLASVAGGRWGNWILVPRRTFSRTTFSSVLPYDVDGRRTAVVATVDGEPSTSPGGDSARVEVRVALLRSGTPVGTVVLGRRLPESVAEELRFDPWHTGGSVRPVGVFNRLRRPAYVASQQGRGAAPRSADGRAGN